VPVPEPLVVAVRALSVETGLKWEIGDLPIAGTEMFVVFTKDHPFPERYTVRSGLLGYRVPANFPTASPEDSFFIQPIEIRLAAPDPVRNSTELNRASASPDLCKGVIDGPVLVFSWHIWNAMKWERRQHKLSDHYHNALKRFEAPEHG
jgi:hypothetical protein